MRINELVIENQQIDELSLAGAGQKVGNVIRGTSAAIQGAKGAWQGAKDAWDQGKQSGAYDKARTAVAGALQQNPGTAPPANQTTAPASSAPPTNTQTPATTGATQPVTAPPAGAAPVAGATQPVTQPPAAGAATPQSASPVAPTRTPTYSSKTAKAEVDKVVGNIQQIRSRDRQGVVQYAQQKLASVKENTVFYSKFLGKEI